MKRQQFILYCALGAAIAGLAGRTAAQSVPPAIRWEHSYGGSGVDDAASINTTRDGGYIFAGSSTSNNGDVSGNHGGRDVWVAKIDSLGRLQWQHSFGGSKDEAATCVQQLGDGGYIVGAYSSSNDNDVSGHHGSHPIYDYYDFWIIRLSAAGDIVWQKSLGGTDNDLVADLQQTSDSGFIVVGKTSSNDGDVVGYHVNPTSLSDWWVVKLNAAGTIQWQEALGGSAEDVASSVRQTTDGGYIVCGSASSIDGDVTGVHRGLRDCWMVKLSPVGGVEWSHAYGGRYNDEAVSVQQTADGGFVMGASTASADGDVSSNHGDEEQRDFWIVKLNNVGEIVWQFSYGGSDSDVVASIRQTSDHGYVILGSTVSIDGDVIGNNGGRDLLAIKIDSIGRIQWRQCFGGSGQDGEVGAGATLQTKDGGFVLAGDSHSNDGDVSGNHGSADAWVVRLILVPRIVSLTHLNIPPAVCVSETVDTIWIHNPGNGQLQITDWFFDTPSGGFSVVVPSIHQTVRVGAGDSSKFVIRFAPQTTGDFFATLNLVNNDPASGHNPWPISIAARRDSIAVTLFGVKNDTLDFGALACGTARDTSFVVASTSSIGTTVRFPASPGSPFRTVPNIFSRAGKRDTINVHFDGSPMPGVFAGTITVTDTCTRRDTIVLRAVIEADPLVIATLRDTTICPGDSAVRTLSIRNRSHARQRVTLTGGGGKFSVATSPLNIAAGDSATTTLTFHGSTTIGTFNTSFHVVDQCDLAHAFVTQVRVDTVSILGLPVSDTSVCAGDAALRIASVRNPGDATVHIDMASDNPLFTIIPDSLTLAPQAIAQVHVVFRGSSRQGDYVMHSRLPGCGTINELVARIHVDSSSIVAQSVPDTTVCPNQPASRTLIVHNISSGSATVSFAGDNPLFSASPSSSTIAARDSAIIQVRFLGTASLGTHTVQFALPGCGASRNVSASVVVDTSSVVVDEPGEATVCPNTPVSRTVRLRNVSQRVLAVRPIPSDSLFTSSLAALTLGAGDTTSVRLTFLGATAAGIYQARLGLPGCSENAAPEFVVHVESPHIELPQAFAENVCPQSPASVTLPITNRDTVLRVIRFSDSNCVVSPQQLAIVGGKTDSMTITLAGAPIGEYQSVVRATDECGISRDISIAVHVQMLPPLQLMLSVDTTAVMIGTEKKVHVIATPKSALAAGTLIFVLENEPTSLLFDGIFSPGTRSVRRGQNVDTIEVEGAQLFATDTVATLFYQTVVGSVLDPDVRLREATTTNTCQSVSGSGNATVSLLPFGCELGTVIVSPFTTSLAEPFPNPASGVAALTYSTNEDAQVVIEIRNAFGNCVQRIVNATLKPGIHQSMFDTRELNSGAYFVTLRHGSRSLSRQFLLYR